MLLSFSIGTFLTNYDVTCRKLNMCYYTPLYENERKWTRNKSMETTDTACILFQELVRRAQEVEESQRQKLWGKNSKENKFYHFCTATKSTKIWSNKEDFSIIRTFLHNFRLTDSIWVLYLKGEKKFVIHLETFKMSKRNIKTWT